MGLAHNQASACLALISEKRWDSLSYAQQHCFILRGLLWTSVVPTRGSAPCIFLTSANAWFIMLASAPRRAPQNSGPMLFVSIHVRCSCVTAYILNNCLWGSARHPGRTKLSLRTARPTCLVGITGLLPLMSWVVWAKMLSLVEHQFLQLIWGLNKIIYVKSWHNMAVCSPRLDVLFFKYY